MLLILVLQLERLKTENTATVAMLTSHLQSLWDRVDMSQEERCQFLADNSGISQRVLHSVQFLVLYVEVKIFVVNTLTSICSDLLNDELL